MLKVKFKIGLFVFFILFCNLKIYSAKTFFMPRPILQDIVLQKNISRNFVNKIYDNGGLKILGTLFYKESEDSDKLTKYFFPTNKLELSVFGPDVYGTPDISSTWLAITDEDENFLTNFSSKIKISPKQKNYGLNLQIFKNLNFLNKRVFISLSMPFTQVETDLNFSEFEKSVTLNNMPLDASDKYFSANATEAFNHKLLSYSKMKDGVQKLAGLSDIKIAIDGIIKCSNLVFIDLYGFGIVPTGYKPKAEYLFEPIVGNGKHFGLGGGSYLNVDFVKSKNKKLAFTLGAEYQYLFKNSYLRTFDLTNNGDLSRYLSVSGNDQTGFFRLANITTLKTDVTPRSSINIFTDFVYSYKNINVMVGYNFWRRDHEKLKLNESFSENYAIRGVDTTIGFNPDNYYPDAKISDNQINRPVDTFTAIKQSDLNLDSAKVESVMSNKLYLNFGFEGKIKNDKCWTTLGFDYELADKNSALSGWSIYLLCGVSI
ncbi:hypothetical protein KJ644_01900 [Candidatus Dependentiae bacterium]|nr:hypothetical protein [Candidatus Dependentiae bacterium]MBU4387205.1 hypothetical protein [Candidatus Dependentiae bacterium]MCG2756032.1 hypothetical protein [Candidatus Dependentiae bacterium]